MYQLLSDHFGIHSHEVSQVLVFNKGIDEQISFGIPSRLLEIYQMIRILDNLKKLIPINPL